MERCMRKCDELGETAAVVERKRKAGFGESELDTFTAQLKKQRLGDNSTAEENSADSTCGSVCSDHVLASCCSSTGFKENSKSVDLEEEENEVSMEFIETSVADSVDFINRRRTMPLREVQLESGEIESSAAMTRRDLNHRRRSTSAKMPSEVELEEFFAAAEKNLQKRFIDKYNFNIVKDEPLEGRYEWVQIKLQP